RERVLELELAIEMILDDPLIAPGDKDEMLDPGRARLVDHVLDQRPVDHRQHLLGHGLCGRQKPGAQTGDREYRFANCFHQPTRWRNGRAVTVSVLPKFERLMKQSIL